MHALLKSMEVQRKQTGFKVYRSMTLTGVNADVKVHKWQQVLRDEHVWEI